MGIGSVLLQPQRIKRVTSVNKDAALINDLIRTIARLLTDPEEAQNISHIMVEAIQETATRFQDRVSARLNNARQRLQNMVQPVINFFQSFDFSSLEDDPEAGMQLAEELLKLLTNVIGSLTLDQLRDYMSELLDVIENDLGITGSFIEDEVWAFVDGIISRLEDIPDSISVKARENRLEIASMLRRARKFMKQEFEFPEFEAETLARVLLDLLRQTGIDDVAKKAACTGKNLGDAAEAVSSINGIVQGIGDISNDGGDEIRSHAWYATWLLHHKYREIPLLTTDDLKRPRDFANMLKNADSAKSRYIRSQLTEQQQSVLDAYDGTSDANEDLGRIIVSVLNKMIQASRIDELAEFGDVDLKPETREVREDFIEDQELLRYNRMLLEDAYPQDLEQIPRTLGSRFGHWLWEKIKIIIGWPGEQVRVTPDGKYLMLDGKIMLSGSNVKWQDAPIFSPPSGWHEGHKYYMFHHICEEFMEGWAWHSAWGNDAIRTLWHLLNIRKTGRAHFLPGMFDAIYDVSHGLTSGIARRPFSNLVFSSSGWWQWFFKYMEYEAGLPLLMTTVGSIQGRYTEARGASQFWYWITVWAGDVINYAGPVSMMNAIRNLTLSFMTTLNFGGPKDAPSTLPRNPAMNYKELDGIVDAVITGFTYWLASYVEREEYTHPFFPEDVPDRVKYGLWLGGSIGMGLFAGFVGTLIAEITAWAEDWALLGWTMLKSIPKVFLQFWLAVYSLREGDTDDGKFNPLGRAFVGYPSKKTGGADTPSPYLLPYEAGSMLYAGQANQGFFSHNPRANGIHTPADRDTMQSYGYDFGFDQGVEVLASRPGTVVDFRETIADNDDTGDWNFIRIRHDVDDAGNPIPPDPNHDRDVGGAVTCTFAEYGHGRHNGVTDAFGTTPIRGTTRVRRGQPIMLAGDTGISFHDHLHMHVLPGNSGPTSATPNEDYTIPFIFQDVGDDDDDGVCKARHWYESTNARVT